MVPTLPQPGMYLLGDGILEYCKACRLSGAQCDLGIAGFGLNGLGPVSRPRLDMSENSPRRGLALHVSISTNAGALKRRPAGTRAVALRSGEWQGSLGPALDP